jgi:hypothetical protein
MKNAKRKKMTGRGKPGHFMEKGEYGLGYTGVTCNYHLHYWCHFLRNIFEARVMRLRRNLPGKGRAISVQ